MARGDVSVLQAQESAARDSLCWVDVLSAMRQAVFSQNGMHFIQSDAIEADRSRQTMTQASKAHSLSKLDLFTPNALHPKLPPLTTGLYTVMGGAATMILERDVLARKAHIQALLSSQGTETDMHRRPATHDRITNHLGVYYCSSIGGWRRAPVLSPAAMDKAVKSMRTEAGRKEYVGKALNKEWEAMGVVSGSSSKFSVALERVASLFSMGSSTRKHGISMDYDPVDMDDEEE
jgi:hypothetical protein